MNSAELNALIRAEADKRDEVDLWELSDAIVAMIPDGDLREVLHVTMRDRVFNQMRNYKREIITAPEPEPTEERPSRHLAPVKPGPSRRSVAVSAWKLKLDALISVQDNRMKRLGACSLDEIKFQVAKLSKQSKDLSERAEWFARIAEAMSSVGVETVADLPETTLRPLLDKAAA